MRNEFGAVTHHGARRVSSLATCVLAVGVFAGAAFFGGCGDDPVVPPVTSTVTGRVTDSAGNPVEGVVVLVGDKPAVTSDAQGAFRVDGVGATYDATVLGPARVDSFKGLTRREPVFRVSVPEAEHRATINGTVPVANDKATRIFFTPYDWNFPVFANPRTGQFSLSVHWYGASTVLEGTVHVLRWMVGSDGLPVEYDGLASRGLVLTDGETANNIEFILEDLDDPQEAKISGVVEIPSGYALSSIATLVILGESRFLLVQESVDPGPTFEFTVPSVTGLAFEVEAFALEGGHHSILRQRGIVPPASEIRLELPHAPRIIQPAHNATDVGYETLFQWEEGGGTGVYALLVLGTLSVWQSGTSTAIPNLADLGLGLTPGTRYEWVVYKVFPLSSVDDLVGPEPWQRAVGPLSGDAHSEYYSFTTPP